MDHDALFCTRCAHPLPVMSPNRATWEAFKEVFCLASAVMWASLLVAVFCGWMGWL